MEQEQYLRRARRSISTSIISFVILMIAGIAMLPFLIFTFL